MRFAFSHHCKAPRNISAGSRLVATNNGSCIPTVIGRICETLSSPTNKLSTATKRIAIIMTMQRREHAAMAKKCFTGRCTHTKYIYSNNMTTCFFPAQTGQQQTQSGYRTGKATAARQEKQTRKQTCTILYRGSPVQYCTVHSKKWDNKKEKTNG